MSADASRFDPTNEKLRKSLQWHAGITIDLQARIVAARRAARGRSDHEILWLLDTPSAPEPPESIPVSELEGLLAGALEQDRLYVSVQALRALLPGADQ